MLGKTHVNIISKKIKVVIIIVMGIIPQSIKLDFHFLSQNSSASSSISSSLS